LNLTGLDLDGVVAVGDPDELGDRPTGVASDSARHGQGGEHDGQASFDGVPLPVVDGAV
jgi:hypothetical protein